MPVTAAIVAGSVQLASTGYQAYQGARQKKKGDKLEKSLIRPTYEISDYTYKNLDDATQMASQGLMASEKDSYLDNLLRQESSDIQSFRGRRAGLTGAEVVGDQTRRGARDLLVMDAKKRQENQLRLMTQRSLMAEEEKTQFQINQLDPYSEKLGYARSLQGAGMQNTSGALGSLSSTTSSLALGLMEGGYDTDKKPKTRNNFGHIDMMEKKGFR